MTTMFPATIPTPTPAAENAVTTGTAFRPPEPAGLPGPLDEAHGPVEHTEPFRRRTTQAPSTGPASGGADTESTLQVHAVHRQENQRLHNP